MAFSKAMLCSKTVKSYALNDKYYLQCGIRHSWPDIETRSFKRNDAIWRIALRT